MQSKGWLLAMKYGYDLSDGSLDKRKVRGLVSSYSQDGYQAQVLQHPIDSYRYISHNHWQVLDYFQG